MRAKAKPPTFDLSGRVALVTGASSGLGARFATILAGPGAVDQKEFDTMLRYLGSDASAGGTGSSFTTDDGQSL